MKRYRLGLELDMGWERMGTRLNDGEETSLRKKINFSEKVRPTKYATSQIDKTKL